MPIFPTLTPGRQTRVVTDVFAGYDHRLKIPDGCFYDTENLSARHYPLLSTRPPRAVALTLHAPGGLVEKDALCWVDDGTLYVNGAPSALTGLTPGDKQLVGMGAYLLVFPDGRWCSTEDPSDCGSLAADLTVAGDVEYALCTADGDVLPDPSVGPEEPDAPENAALWLDTSGGARRLLQWSAAASLWTELATVYTRVTLPSMGELPRQFRQFDGVTVSGTGLDALDGEKILYALGGGAAERDWFVLVGLLDAGFVQEGGSVRLQRTIPQMDYVCQCQNRLWGCRYGRDGGETVNEIYASALGDFRNFHQFLGLSTDSWAASVGSDGEFTGAVSYLGHPCFFKENGVHVVTVSAIGAHRVDETVCRGVQRGSARSLQVVGESLYYKSREDVCVWQGGFPQSVSAALGGEAYREAAAGAIDGRYYISMCDASDRWHLFTFDTERGIWYREDDLHARCFAAADGELYCLEADTGRVLALKGTVGEPEESLRWMAESGILHYQTADRKYVSRYALSLRMRQPASLSIYLRYDSDGDWELSGQVALSGTGTVTVPIRPRRCDHLQLRLVGEGEVKLYAITRVLELGSDM
ncbi:MAG: hypothetical protein IJ594_09925 [Oscillospiraceae bacterium]|nr:hypothetical protein [Oscillospiraceae bacterium]